MGAAAHLEAPELYPYRRWGAAVLVVAALATLALIGYMSGGGLASSAAYGYCSGSQYEYCSTTSTSSLPPIVAASLRSFTARQAVGGVLLRWQTASEWHLLGFRLYRARAGRWLRVDARLIRARGAVHGAAYSYLDRGAPRRAVRYRLQAVGTDGSRAFSALARAPSR